MTGMSDPLAQLKDIHLPQPVSWWPPAPGWWVVALTVCILTVWGGRRLWQYVHRNRYRRAALAALAQLEGSYAPGDEQTLPLLREVAALLRRAAIEAYGRSTVAQLSGDEWLAFLDRTGRTDQFGTGPGRALGTMLYQPALHADRNAVCRLAAQWLRRHRPC